MKLYSGSQFQVILSYSDEKKHRGEYYVLSVSWDPQHPTYLAFKYWNNVCPKMPAAVFGLSRTSSIRCLNYRSSLRSGPYFRESLVDREAETVYYLGEILGEVLIGKLNLWPFNRHIKQTYVSLMTGSECVSRPSHPLGWWLWYYCTEWKHFWTWGKFSCSVLVQKGIKTATNARKIKK